ncbi:MAG: hypothetical protein ACPGTP_04325 [Bacteroidia bacterium]
MFSFGFSQAQTSVFKARFKSLQNGEPILYAKISSPGFESKLTNINGDVQIQYNEGAKLIVSHLVYDTLVINTNDWKNRDSLLFYLQPKVYQLREVTFSILGQRSLFDNKFVKNDLGKSDEEKVRDKLKILGLRDELIGLDKSAQGGMVLGSPISYLYDKFSKSGKERTKYEMLVARDRQRQITKKQFDNLTVTMLTNYTEEDLEKFKSFCEFHPSYLKAVDALTLYYEIIRCKKEYVEKGF